MARLLAFIGIGFMLVGALAYALPPQQEVYRILPSVVGVLIALLGLVGLSGASTEGGVMFASLTGCVLLIVYSVSLLIPDWAHVSRSSVGIVTDLSVLGYSAVFIYAVRRQLFHQNTGS